MFFFNSNYIPDPTFTPSPSPSTNLTPNCSLTLNFGGEKESNTLKHYQELNFPKMSTQLLTQMPINDFRDYFKHFIFSQKGI